MPKETPHFVLCVMSSSSGVRVVNIETLDGISETQQIRAFGFTENGYPCTNQNDPKIHYKLSGPMFGTVDLNHVYRVGQKIFGRNAKNELVVKELLTDYAAVSFILSRNGLAISPNEVQTEMQKHLKAGTLKIFVYRECWMHGLKESYGLFEDSWNFNGRPDSDIFIYDELNALLKSLDSPYRVATPKVLKLLQKLEYQKLAKSSDL